MDQVEAAIEFLRPAEEYPFAAYGQFFGDPLRAFEEYGFNDAAAVGEHYAQFLRSGLLALHPGPQLHIGIGAAYVAYTREATPVDISMGIEAEQLAKGTDTQFLGYQFSPFGSHPRQKLYGALQFFHPMPSNFSDPSGISGTSAVPSGASGASGASGTSDASDASGASGASAVPDHRAGAAIMQR